LGEDWAKYYVALKRLEARVDGLEIELEKLKELIKTILQVEEDCLVQKLSSIKKIRKKIE